MDKHPVYGNGEWTEQDSIILFRNWIYVPNDPELRRRIIQSYHDQKITGHPERFKTQELVQRDFWWPGIETYIRNYVNGCAICHITKNQPQKPKIPINPITPSEEPEPFDTVSIDFIGELPGSTGNNAIMVVVDQGCTKGTVFIPCTTNTGTEEAAALYVTNVWRRFGLPHFQILDRGPQFAVKFTEELCKRLGIKRAMSTAFYPQTDGKTEQVNQELEQYLRAYCNHRQDNWAELLLAAEFVHNH